jgi:hypothetical protein
MPGALPPTPGTSEGEYEPEDPEPGYVLVERMRTRADFSAWEDGDVPPVPPKNDARDSNDESG